jgi:hypothetical protein
MQLPEVRGHVRVFSEPCLVETAWVSEDVKAAMTTRAEPLTFLPQGHQLTRSATTLTQPAGRRSRSMAPHPALKTVPNGLLYDGYQRHLAALPWGPLVVRLHPTVHPGVGRTTAWAQRLCAERLPDLAALSARHARRPRWRPGGPGSLRSPG